MDQTPVTAAVLDAQPNGTLIHIPSDTGVWVFPVFGHKIGGQWVLLDPDRVGHYLFPDSETLVEHSPNIRILFAPEPGAFR